MPRIADLPETILQRRWANAALAVVLLLLAIVPVLLTEANEDVAWYTYLTGRVLEGDRLYVDLVEINPPLVIAVMLPAVTLARTLGAPAVPIFVLYSAAIALASWGACRRRLRTWWEDEPRSRGFLLVLLAFVLMPWARGSFGEREHLALLLTMPYLLEVGERTHPSSTKWRFFLGLLAGVGFSLKPHLIAAWFAVEGYVLIRDRRLSSVVRAETLAVAATVTIYLLSILLLTPHYLPLVRVLGDVYGGYNVPLAALVTSTGTLIPLAALVAFFLTPRDSPDRELERVLAVAIVGFLVSPLVQQKGWPYHFYPATGTALILLGLSGWSWCRAPSVARSRLGAKVVSWLPLAAVVGMLGLAAERTVAALAGRGARSGNMEALVQLSREHATEGHIWVVSTSLSPGFPLVNYADVGWSSRFAQLWMLPGLYADVRGSPAPFPYHSREEMDDVERSLVDAVADDLARHTPALVFVHTSPRKEGLGTSGFDYLEYFTRDPRIARFFTDYHLLTTVGPWEVYRRETTAG